MSGAAQLAQADRPSWDLYSRCIRCGLCLNACPTYRVLHEEMDSPRGRIYQVLQVDAGRLAVGESLVTHIDRCLDCRGCESACPSGVQYGKIIERARALIEQQYRRPWLTRRLRDYFFNSLLPDYSRLERWAKFLRSLQRSGIAQLARRLRILRFFRVEAIAELAPKMDDNFFFSELGKTFPAEGRRRARVAFLAGCIASTAFAELNRATIRVLQKNGIEVVIPREQGCCGALQAHAGYREQARSQARRNIRAMLADNFDAIITNAAGCGASMKDYPDLLEHDSEFAQLSQDFSAKIRDITEYLSEIGVVLPAKKLSARVTYQDPCHLAHAQHVREAPRKILTAIGAELVEMAHSDLCCGSAGTYNVLQNDISMRILDSKMEEVAAVNPQIIATANVGCMLQLRAGVKRRGLRAEVKHVIELFDDAYRA